jgi:hypothetical protein
MKKAALVLLMSSTAFAAGQVAPQAAPQVAPQAATKPIAKKKATSQKPPQLARKIVHGQKTLAPQAPQLAPQLAATQPQLAKRAPRQTFAANVPVSPDIQAPKFGNFELKAQLRNTMTMARAQELQNVDGQNYGLNTEVRVGLKHVSGWGFNLTGAHKTNNYADSAKNTGTNGDASLMVYTPPYIKNDSVSVYSIVRPYIPTSERSQATNTHSLEFRNYIDLTFSHKLTATNFTLVRFFDADKMGDGDLTSLVYNALEFYHQTLPKVALAFGAQYEADNSYRSGTGTQVDVYPFIDFNVIPNVLIEPKYYFPVSIGGNRSVDASGVALDQSKAELFIKIAI